MISGLLAEYPTLSLSQRTHMWGRWMLCPFRPLSERVPCDGQIVDLGCGHGLFSLLLARESAARQVTGIDLDGTKIALAQSLRQPNLEFIAGDIAQLKDLPPARAFTIIDVFYLVPYEAQERLLSLCATRLAPNGVIILKDMAEAPRWKRGLNWVEEFLAVRVLRITRGDEFYFRTRSEWQAVLQKLGLDVEIVRLDRGYYHPHILYIARQR